MQGTVPSQAVQSEGGIMGNAMINSTVNGGWVGPFGVYLIVEVFVTG